MSQQIWAHEDGSGRMLYRIGLDEKLVELNGTESDESFCQKYHQQKSKLEQHTGVVEVRVDSERQAGIRYCIMDIYVERFTDLPALHKMVMQDARQGARQEQGEIKTVFELTDNEDGTGDFLQQISNRAGEPGKHPFNAQAEQIANVVMAQMMTGRYWTVTMYAPTITDSNGDVAEDKKSVQWKIPLHDLLMDKDYITEMNAEFEFDLPWYKRIWKWVS